MEEMLEKEECPEDEIPWDDDLPSAEEIPPEREEKPAVKGVRPAEGMPLPEKGFGSLSLWERAALFRDDPEGYKRARNVI
ncbi:MAG: hypothetical protein IJD13_01410 [Oscillospiraceae bacterium]|nr:hypothetical protein [Oscillospiraceae bacterium]